jgi:hypothetical protein
MCNAFRHCAQYRYEPEAAVNKRAVAIDGCMDCRVAVAPRSDGFVQPPCLERESMALGLTNSWLESPAIFDLVLFG